MGGFLHGSARTTPRVRAELQASKEKTSLLAKQYGLSRTTVEKWRRRSTTSDARMGPRHPKSTVLTPVEEAMVVALRRRTLALLWQIDWNGLEWSRLPVSWLADMGGDDGLDRGLAR